MAARTSTSPHRVGGSIFDHELASVELVVLGVYQSGGRMLYAREIDKRESGGRASYDSVQEDPE